MKAETMEIVGFYEKANEKGKKLIVRIISLIASGKDEELEKLLSEYGIMVNY